MFFGLVADWLMNELDPKASIGHLTIKWQYIYVYIFSFFLCIRWQEQQRARAAIRPLTAQALNILSRTLRKHVLIISTGRPIGHLSVFYSLLGADGLVPGNFIRFALHLRIGILYVMALLFFAGGRLKKL